MRLLQGGFHVTGIDNLNPYYDVTLKMARLDILRPHKNFVFYKEDIQNLTGIKAIFRQYPIDRICNLAAQAGVRHSLKDPFTYQRSNLEGFLNLLEMAREYKVNNFVYASSSSVYGNNKNVRINPQIKIKPFMFILELLMNKDIEYLTNEEIAIPVIYGHNRACLKLCIEKILQINFINLLHFLPERSLTNT